MRPPNTFPLWRHSRSASRVVDDAVTLSLSSVVDSAIYEARARRLRGASNIAKGRELLRRLTADDVRDTPTFTSPASSVENFFTSATKPGANLLLVSNCENPPDGVRPVLGGLSGHLDKSNNDSIEELPGINTSMFYVGETNSFAGMRVEDSVADGLTLLHAGTEKIWVVVDRKHYVQVNSLVADELHRLDKITERCTLPMHHKNIMLTPRFLDDHKIRYEFIVQEAGDLVFVRYGTLHQEINCGLNMAEEITIGSNAWNIVNDVSMLCPCVSDEDTSTCLLSRMETNEVDMIVRVSKKKVRTCKCDTCDRVFRTKALLETHRRDDHDARVACELCSKTYTYARNLVVHIRLEHTEEEPKSCPICNKTFRDLRRHQKRHTKMIECDSCGDTFAESDIVRHRRNCYAQRFICPGCKKEFASVRSLGNHRSRWCKA